MPEILEQDAAAIVLAPAKSAPRLKHLLYIALTVAIAGTLLYFSLRGIAWSQVGESLASAQLLYVACSLGFTTAALFLRAVRWRVLLGTEARVSTWTSFQATAAGYLGNNVLPARAGELVRTLHVTRRTGASKTFVLTTIICERVSDAIALLIIIAATLTILPSRPGWMARAATPFCILGFCGIAVIALAPWIGVLSRRILDLLRMPERVRTLVLGMIDSVVLAARQFHDPKRLLQFTALTGVIWVFDGLTGLMIAMSLSLGLSLPVVMLLNSALGLGSAVPSTPGYVGVFQFVTISVLTPFGVAKSAALAYSLVSQACSYVVVILCGSIGLLQFRRRTASE